MSITKDAINAHFSGDFTPFYQRYVKAKLRPDKRGGFETLCPLHDETAPSFGFKAVDGQFHCFGCGKGGDIFTFYALSHNLDIKAGFPVVLAGIAADFGIGNGHQAISRKVKSRIVKVYDYTDAAGKVIHQTVRYDPKTFKQRKLLEGGGYQWNLKGIKPLLYRLPEVIRANEILLVEGEKDVDNLRGLGFTATTSPQGSSSWRPHYADYLKGKRVVIIPDNDEPGAGYLEAVGGSLLGVAESVKVIQLPDGVKDASDFILTFDDAETAKERLCAMIDGAEPYQPAIRENQKGEGSEAPSVGGFELIDADELTRDMKPPDFLIDGHLENKTVSQIFGQYGDYKTFISLSMAGSIATGVDWLGHKVKPGPVVYILGEGHGGFGRRLRAFLMYHGLKSFGGRLMVSRRPAMMTVKESAEAVKRSIDDFASSAGVPALIVVDTLNRNFGPGNENQTADMTTFVTHIDHYIRGESTILIVHHSGIHDKSRGRGSNVLPAAIDTEYKVAAVRPLLCKMSCTKMKDFEMPTPFNIEMKVVMVGEVDGKTITSLMPAFQSEADTTGADDLSGTPGLAYAELVNLYCVNRKNLERGGYNPAGAKITVEEWKNVCINLGLYKDQRSFNLMKRRLAEKGKILISEPHVFINDIPNGCDIQ